MSCELEDVFAQCEKTASWYGIKISRVNQRNPFGDTPLHTVCSWGEVSLAKVLLDAGADVNALGDHGCTPLFNAVIGRNPELVKALLASGADPAIGTFDGRSVLEYALNVRAPEAIVTVLRQHC